MSVQYFLQGQLSGIQQFLLSPAHESEWAGAGVAGEALLLGRSRWVALLSEILPRVLLTELGLPKIMLGSSGGSQFLVILPDEVLPRAGELLEAAADGVRRLSDGFLSLDWASTENLGDWAVVRRRLAEEMRQRHRLGSLAQSPELFAPFVPPRPADTEGYFVGELGKRLSEAAEVGWSPDNPARICLGGGHHNWPLMDSAEAILLARHTAPADNDTGSAGVSELAARAQGRKVWGVLRGDVDHLSARLRRLPTIEEHVQLSMLYKQFFAGELEVACSLPEFWRKVSIIYTSASDFAVYGSWDALVSLAREVQRLFHRFNEENLKEIPGAEGKTISMALALAPGADTLLAEAYVEAGRRLKLAKSAGVDCFHVFDHTVEWRQVAQAAELHEDLKRLVREFGGAPELLDDLIRLYESAGRTAGGGREVRIRRPWRYHRRLSLLGRGARDREFQKLLSRLMVELIGKNAAQARLRPGGRVALAWAKLLTEA